MQAKLNFRDALRARDRGIDSARRNSSYWVDLMRDEAIRLSQYKVTLTTDDLADYAAELAEMGIRPKHHNAWGSIFRGSEWEAVGYTRSAKVQRHTGVIRVWRRT